MTTPKYIINSVMLLDPIYEHPVETAEGSVTTLFRVEKNGY